MGVYSKFIISNKGDDDLIDIVQVNAILDDFAATCYDRQKRKAAAIKRKLEEQKTVTVKQLSQTDMTGLRNEYEDETYIDDTWELIPLDQIDIDHTDGYDFVPEFLHETLRNRRPYLWLKSEASIRRCFSAEYHTLDWYVGEEGYYLYLDDDEECWDDDDEFKKGEFFDDSFKDAYCSKCKGDLLDPVVHILKRFLRASTPPQRYLFPQERQQFTCPYCKHRCNINDLLPRKLIGKFRIDVHFHSRTIPNCVVLYELINRLNEETGLDLYLDVYQHL